MALCLAKTKSDKQCQNEAVRGKRYCGLPSHQKMESFWDKIWYGIYFYRVAIITMLISLGVSCYFFLLSPGKDDLRKLNDRLDKIITNQKASFDEKYPRGYKLLAVGNNGMVISRLDTNKDFIIDWNMVSVAFSDQNEIEIFLPKIYNIKHHYNFDGVRWIFPRTLGKKMFPVGMSDYALMADVLDVSSTGLICVIYFEDKQKAEKEIMDQKQRI